MTDPIIQLAARKSRGTFPYALLGLCEDGLKPIGHVDGYSSAKEIAAQIIDGFNLAVALREEHDALTAAIDALKEGRGGVDDLPAETSYGTVGEIFLSMYDIRPISVRIPPDLKQANIALVGTYARANTPLAYIVGRLPDGAVIAQGIAEALNGVAELESDVVRLREEARELAADGPRP
jgi:hypothetical protein